MIFFFRFCVGDRFYLCDNKILCESDYDDRQMKEKLNAGNRQMNNMMNNNNNNNNNSIDNMNKNMKCEMNGSKLPSKRYGSVNGNQNAMKPHHNMDYFSCTDIHRSNELTIGVR